MSKKLLALMSGCALSAMLLTGCGNNNNDNTPEVNDVKENVEEGAEDVKRNIEEGAEDVKNGVERGVNDINNNGVNNNRVDENGKEIVPNDTVPNNNVDENMNNVDNTTDNTVEERRR
ncbi:hypothetical protein [Bacillus massiliigorillae]|uniref:hypothetical protein n=1 Tax=Bacillus massiliigorillae TaxID=1243664 RepID=UPI00039D22F2|nr:hypothetical protein [Bacillus massiliigorillae]